MHLMATAGSSQRARRCVYSHIGPTPLTPVGGVSAVPAVGVPRNQRSSESGAGAFSPAESMVRVSPGAGETGSGISLNSGTICEVFALSSGNYSQQTPY